MGLLDLMNKGITGSDVEEDYHNLSINIPRGAIVEKSS